jgi:hypothetical protein
MFQGSSLFFFFWRSNRSTHHGCLTDEKVLGSSLKLVSAEDMPLVMRHHARFYELIGAHATLWQKPKK